MRIEERSERIHDALSFLDDEMIEEVDELRGEGSAAKKATASTQEGTRRVFAWKRWAVLAASICLVLGINYVWNGSNVESNDYWDDKESLDNQESMESHKEHNQEDKIDLEDYHDEIEDSSGVSDAESEILDGFLNGYKEVYFGEKLLSGENLELIAKFTETYENGVICNIDISSDMESVAEGHLYFKYEDGSSKHLILLGNGIVYCKETSECVQMDRRIYNLIVEILKGES